MICRLGWLKLLFQQYKDATKSSSQLGKTIQCSQAAFPKVRQNPTIGPENFVDAQSM